ncbi:MAG: hypothetical protein QOD83_2677, partial [Solirubrobacteraceae bacterium]|nr:hypothetical protein [Solirubrobacteraceae bacterium]
RLGVNVDRGEIVHPAVAEALGIALPAPRIRRRTLG